MHYLQHLNVGKWANLVAFSIENCSSL